MPIPRRDELDFKFRDGKGIRTDQLYGSFVKSISGGQVTYQDALGNEQTESLAAASVATPTVRNLTANYVIVAADLGNTVRLTGATARTFTLPAHGDEIPIGAILYVINDATAPLTVDGSGADTVDGEANLVLVPNEAVTLQKVANNAWDLLSDTTSGEGTNWADIPVGSPIRLGQVVTHGGAFFGAITAHNKTAVGPDGDAVNWVQISNWRGNWQNAWYPVGSFVRDGGLPFVAISAVVRNDPRPTASNNVKWLLLGSSPSNVVIASSNTNIPTTADHDTYIHTGSADITYTLPAASGGGAVDDAWEAVFTNQGVGDLTITANGADTIDGSSSDIVLDLGETIRVQKVANGTWILIADTRGGATEDSVARNSAQEALEAAQQNRDRIQPIEQKTADVNIIDDGPTYVEAPAAEAGIAIFAEGSTVGDGLLGGTRPLEAGDLTGYAWAQSQATGATRQAVIVRIEGTLGPTDYALNVDGTEHQMHDYRKVLSDDTWDYFYAGGFESVQLRIDKRGRAHHTEWRGAIGGRALEQVDAEIEAHEPDPSVTVDPPVWGDDASPRTLFVTLHDLRPTPALRAVDKIRLDLQGAVFATHSWNLLYGARTIAFPISDSTELTNIANNVSPDGNNNVVRGQIQFHATAGGNPTDDNEVLDARLSFSMSVVAPGDVPQPGGHTTFVEHPRVFHANAFIVVDPDDNTLRRINFSPNEDGLVPIPNSLFTFVWGHAPGFNLSGFTMAPRGTQAAQATAVLLRARDGVTPINDTGDLTQNTVYLARFTGASIIILTALMDAPAPVTGPGGLATSPIGSGDFNATTQLEYASDANSADITVPAEGKWGLVNFGGTSATDAHAGEWHLIDLDELRAAVANYGDNATTTTNKGLRFADSLHTGHDAYLGVAADRKVLFASSGPVDAFPLTLLLVTSVDIPDFLDEEAVNALIAARHNLLIDDPVNPIAASGNNEDKVLYRAKRLYKNEPIHFADPDATYRDFAAATDLPNGYSWGGAVQASPAASAQPDNRVIYSIPGGHFLRKITGGGSSWWVQYTPPGWRGPVTDQSDADRVVKAVGDKVFFGGKVQVVATYTPRMPDQWHWVPMVKERFSTPLAASPAVLPEGTETISGYMQKGTANADSGDRYPFSIDVEDLPTTQSVVSVETHNTTDAASDDRALGIQMTYVAATRTLTYSPVPVLGGGTNASEVGHLRVIRAKGQA